MSWRPIAKLVSAFLLAGLTVWFSPALLGPLGLSEFAFIGQLCLTILVLSVLQAVFNRLREPSPTPVPQPDP